MRWIQIVVGVAGLVLVITTGNCTRPTPEDDMGNGSFEPPPVNVSVVKLEPSQLTEKLVLTGRLEPWLEVEVSSELGGTVQEIGFEKGRYVDEGMILARVGTDILTVSLEEAEAALEEAEANYNRTKELFERQAVTRQELVTYTSRYRAAQARLAMAKLRVDRSVIEAPISGMAINRHVDVGEVIPPGAPITTLHQLSRLKANAGIPEDDISFFQVGEESTVEVDAYPGRQFEGRIHFIGPAVTGTNRTFPCEVAIANPSGDLRPGMIARVILEKRHFENSLVVPRDALLDRDQGSVAFVSENGRARERPVVLGPGEGNRVVVLEGLTPGESLIVSGHRNLVDGQALRVVN